MAVNPIALTIRAKKLGVLIRDARIAREKSIADCAQALGVPEETFEAYELGEKSPSLPEVEVLAYTLDVPLDHFWGDRALSTNNEDKRKPDLNRTMDLRQRIIGTLLRKARLEAGLSPEELAEKAWSSPTLLEAYELGEEPIPLPDLEMFSAILDHPLKEFQDKRGPVGKWAAEQRSMQEFLALSPKALSGVGAAPERDAGRKAARGCGRLAGNYVVKTRLCTCY